MVGEKAPTSLVIFELVQEVSSTKSESVRIALIVPRLIVALAEESQPPEPSKLVSDSVNSALVLELFEAMLFDVDRHVLWDVEIDPFNPKVFAITIYPHVYVLGEGAVEFEELRVTLLDPARSTV